MLKCDQNKVLMSDFQAEFESSAISLVKFLAKKYKLFFSVVIEGDIEVTKRIIAGAELNESRYSVKEYHFDPNQPTSLYH